MASEKRLKNELNKIREQLQVATARSAQQEQQHSRQRRGSSCSSGNAEEDSHASKKIKKLEEEVAELDRALAAKEQEGTMLEKEMEVRYLCGYNYERSGRSSGIS